MAELTKVKKSVMEESQVLPDMAGQDGKVLSNNGAIPIWIPKQKAERIVGEIFRFSFETPPPGFFALDGSRIVNGKNDFSALAGCGSRFVTVSGNDLILEDFVDFGRGKGSSGRSVGTFENDAIRNIYGTMKGYGNSGLLQVNKNDKNSVFSGSLSVEKGTNPLVEYLDNYIFSVSGNSSYSLAKGLNFNASKVVPTASENRPKSLTELVCIYHGVI